MTVKAHATRRPVIILLATACSSTCSSQVTCLVADNERLAVRRPDQRKSVTKPRHLVEARFRADIPEFYNAIAADASQLRILGRVEGDLFDGRRVALELCREPDVVLVRVPLAPLSVHIQTFVKMQGCLQTRNVLSTEPVAMSEPSGFHAMVRKLLRTVVSEGGTLARWRAILAYFPLPPRAVLASE